MLLEINNLSKEYIMGFWNNKHVNAVKNASFSVEKGDVFGIIGESGSGKTTIIKMILGIIKASEGSALFDGKDLLKLKKNDWYKMRKEIQVVFQHPQMTFNPRRNIYFACSEPIRLYNLTDTQEQERDMVLEMIEQVGITEDQLKKYPHELSGGQAQRLSIIRALCLKPRMLICDEPTSMLDVSTQAQIIKMLKRVKLEQGLTMLYISHNLDVIRNLCNKVAVMKQGEIVECGETEKIFCNPTNDYTKFLLNSTIDI